MIAVLRQAPNILSGLRLVAAPIAAWLILHGEDFPALCVFCLAGLSDAADGFLAKKFGLASRFGAWLDPAADKLLMLASFVSLTYVGAVPLWLTAMVIGRDIAIVLGVLLAKLLGMPLEVKPLMVGKVSTVVQVLYIVLVLLLLTLHEAPVLPANIGVAMVALLTAWSFLAYAQIWLKAAFRRVPQGDGTA
ncbi:CDP-alcohol phosphatidyltransferase family protein [Rhizomicrobium electricum]|uniref:CDP-diacylglycerol--glycerol-3-phosphate 3-phosphatidyltransferase n=1 Tax=Rhizomicrobium electricum TaxID=480070 RepID=A0ABN1EC67_9PROT|nr:CDP-alcohol phosphatidyltransferase family protein [Rhizomicrobium electricum]NIJ48188.1 cardiolipin synthase [Rhizomicrobium electricum]